MLDSFSRGAIIALSTLCVVGAIALAPIRARSSIEDVGLHPAPVIAERAFDPVAILPIRRDPFSAPVVRATSVLTNPGAHDAAAVAEDSPAASEPARHGRLEPLPNNLATDTIPALPGGASDSIASAARVTAIVTGDQAHPYAMVETGNAHEIKGIGDRIAGVAIVAIDLGGIRLQNGERLVFSTSSRP